MKQKNKKHPRLILPLAALALLIPSASAVKAETVIFEPDSMTYFLQNEQLNQGWAIHEGIFSVSGEAAYCIEPKETVAIGEDLYETSSWDDYSGYPEDLKNTILELSYFGYGFGGRTDSEYWYATQILIWQAINPAFAETRVYRDSAYGGNLLMSPQAVEITDSVNQKKQEILDAVAMYHTGLDPKITDGEGNRLSMPLNVRAGDTVIFTDEHLSSWHLTAADDCIAQDGNTLRFCSKTAGTHSFSLQYEGTGGVLESAPLVLKARDGSKIQTLIIRGKADTKTVPLQVTVRDLSLKIHKSDSEQRSRTAGETSLANARYELFNVTENTSCGTFITDENGDSNIIGGLNAADTYSLRETQAPRGFMKDETVTEFRLDELEHSEDLYCRNLTDTVIRGKIAIHKVISSRIASGPLKDEKDAVFAVLPVSLMQKYTSAQEALKHTDELFEDEYDVLVTDAKGRAQSHDLVYGTYMVIQTGAMSPELEFCQPFRVSIDGSQPEPHLYELSNLQNEYALKIIKKDAGSGKRITLHSAAFQVFDSEGNLITQKTGASVYDTFMTNADIVPSAAAAGVWHEKSGEKGTVVLPLRLPAGIYTIREVMAPYGYEKAAEEITVEISAASGAQTAEAVVENRRRSGSLSLQKTIAPSDADTSLVSRDNLSGYTFELSAEKNILSPDDGSVITAAGAKITEITTGENGTAMVTDLPYGSYKLREVRAPAGVRLDDQTIVLNIGEETENLSFTAENKPVLTAFSKRKAAGSEELPGAHLSVITEEGTLIDEWISAENPHVIEGLDPLQTYILREDLTPRDADGSDAGYVRSEEIRFSPGSGEELTEIVMKDEIVTVEKTDENGEPLCGAYLQVVNQDNEITDSWISDGTPHIVRGLSQSDTCILQELKAPDGYYRSDDIPFTVRNDGKDMQIHMSDSLIRLRIRKVDEKTGKDLPGVTLTLYEITEEGEKMTASWLTEGTAIAADGLLKAGTMYRLEETEWTEGWHRAADLYFETDDIDPLAEEPLTIVMRDAPVETGAAKTDSEGNLLAGARLCVKDEAGNVLHEWVSSDKGPEELSPYLAGGKTYILEETEAPEGYALMEPIRFQANGSAERHQLIHAVNRKVRIRLEIYKTDAADAKPLAGAVFQVYRSLDDRKALDTDGKNARVTTGEDGCASLVLPYEKTGYYVLETKAPSGYRLNRTRFDVQAELRPCVPVIRAGMPVSNEKKTVETGIGGPGGRVLIVVSGVLMCVFLMFSKRLFS
ncbi:MAG: SpaA isopeptide-forming pilin-related protein [Erysipelotrichaceae bacterium]|nr:SpaA isopeptide-forming pilin-related protein [Erysipelotrichaceae bacterium]